MDNLTYLTVTTQVLLFFFQKKKWNPVQRRQERWTSGNQWKN